MTNELLDRYLAVNSRYGRPFIYKLTNRGFYSEVNNLLNAMIFGLSKRRRLVVDESDFEGLRWSNFFTAKLPDAPQEVMDSTDPGWVVNGSAYANFYRIAAYAERRHERWIPLILPSIGFMGRFRTLKRQFAEVFTAPIGHTDLPVPGYAAFHIRKGDKLLASPDLDADGKPLYSPEGEDTPTRAYLMLLRSKAPNIRRIFVMTDDYTTVEDLRRAAPEFDIWTHTSPEERGYMQDNFSSLSPSIKAEKLERLLAETQIALSSSIFLGGFKSNVSRFITLKHKTPEQCFSVDEQKTWHPR